MIGKPHSAPSGAIEASHLDAQFVAGTLGAEAAQAAIPEWRNCE